VNDVARELTAMRQWAERHPPVNRESFERLYTRYAGVRDKVERVRVQGTTLEMLTGL